MENLINKIMEQIQRYLESSEDVENLQEPIALKTRIITPQQPMELTTMASTQINPPFFLFAHCFPNPFLVSSNSLT